MELSSQERSGNCVTLKAVQRRVRFSAIVRSALGLEFEDVDRASWFSRPRIVSIDTGMVQNTIRRGCRVLRKENEAKKLSLAEAWEMVTWVIFRHPLRTSLAPGDHAASPLHLRFISISAFGRGHVLNVERRPEHTSRKALRLTAFNLTANENPLPFLSTPKPVLQNDVPQAPRRPPAGHR